jgi:hypothetical protein
MKEEEGDESEEEGSKNKSKDKSKKENSKDSAKNGTKTDSNKTIITTTNKKANTTIVPASLQQYLGNGNRPSNVKYSTDPKVINEDKTIVRIPNNEPIIITP